MDVWLSDFLNAHPSAVDLGDLAAALVTELNRVVPAAIRGTYISGFHLAGFNRHNAPEFWFIRNVADDHRTLMRALRGARGLSTA